MPVMKSDAKVLAEKVAKVWERGLAEEARKHLGDHNRHALVDEMEEALDSHAALVIDRQLTKAEVVLDRAGFGLDDAEVELPFAERVQVLADDRFTHRERAVEAIEALDQLVSHIPCKVERGMCVQHGNVGLPCPNATAYRLVEEHRAHQRAAAAEKKSTP
jgi:hypothetical protein